MQQTRLNRLIDLFTRRIIQFFTNPWRRIALLLIGLLLGIFLGSAISTTAGQVANWDVSVAALLLLFTEIINRLVYQRKKREKYLFLELLNVLKMGITYSLFLEAFKLGS